MGEPTTCSDDGARLTAAKDHIGQFWHELEKGHVRILVATLRDTNGTPNWVSSSYSDEVAKALVAGRAAYPVIRKGTIKVERLTLQYDPVEKEPFAVGAATGEFVRYSDYAQLAAGKIGAGLWHPIETAPTDGAEIDIWIAGPGSRRIANCRWAKPSRANWGDHFGEDKDLPFQWITRDGFALDRRNGQPSHWMFPPNGPSFGVELNSLADHASFSSEQYG
ncbi:hypothetical protein MAUB1S_10093 [Mycolicibacterium aubagnense]